MDAASFSFLGQQLAYSLPQLLVYLVGLILAVVFFRKYSGAALLLLCGSVVLLFTSLGQTFIQFYLFRARVESGWTPAGYAQMLSIVSVIASIMRAVGLALWLAAVFAGRKRQNN